MFTEVRTKFGKLEIFVSNARPEAAEFFQPPMDITLKQWDAASDSQGKAFLIAVREASALMSSGGRIIAITYAQGSRTGSLLPWVGMGSAKAALESLVRYFAVALAKRGAGITRPLFRRGTGQTRHHSECDQSGADREQRAEQSARRGAGSHQELAQARLDPDGTPGNAGRHRQRGGTLSKPVG
jgi:NAD(P)-dependent dehydrogenase (short-subunit alcohol dehydrogenase family)